LTASPIAVASAERDLAVLLPVSDDRSKYGNGATDEVRVTLGVDTHKDVHVAVAVDQLGRRLGELSIPTNPAGYARLIDWASPTA
jgi:hypothetical protein